MATNTIETVLELKDRMTAGLRTAKSAMGAWQETVDKVHTALPKVSDDMRKVGQQSSVFDKFAPALALMIGKLETISIKLSYLGDQGAMKINQLDYIAQKTSNTFASGLNKTTREANETAKAVKKIDTEGKKLSASDWLSKLGLSFMGLKAIAQTAASTIMPVFEEGMAREVASTNFSTLLSGELTRGADETIKDFQQRVIANGTSYADTLRNSDMATLYGTSTINENAQSMLAYGLDKNTALETLTAIGDIAMGDANKMSSLATAFSQMASLGKLQTQDWKQMVGAGFNPFNQMQKDLGLTAEQLDQMMQKGQITADMVKNAFVNATKDGGQFEGALKNVLDNTLQGKMAMFSSQIDDIKAQLYSLVLPIVNRVLPVITESLIPAISDIFDALSPVFGFMADNIDTIGVFAGVIGSVALGIKIWTGVQWLLNAAMTANPIGLVVVGIAALVTLIYKVVDAYDRWGAAATIALGPIGMIVNIVMTFKRYWDSIVDSFTNGGFIAGIKQIGLALLDLILYPVQQLLNLLSNIPMLGGLAQKGADWIAETRKNLNMIDPEKKEDEQSASSSLGTDNITTTQSITGAPSGSEISATGNADSVAGSAKQIRNITVNIDSFNKGGINTTNTDGLKGLSSVEIENWFNDMLLRNIRNMEMSY